jgi:hypothetical protein
MDNEKIKAINSTAGLGDNNSTFDVFNNVISIAQNDINNKVTNATVQTEVNSVSNFYNRMRTNDDVDDKTMNSMSLQYDSNFSIRFEFPTPTDKPILILPTSTLLGNAGTVYDNLREVYSRYADQHKNITTMVQSIDIPNLTAPVTKQTLPDIYGNVITPTYSAVIPHSHTFNIDFLSTEQMFIESLLMPWMDQLKSPVWAYADHPYETATVKVYVYNQSGTEIVTVYTIHEVVPTVIDTLDLSHRPTKQFTRGVTFTFNYVTVEYNPDTRHKDVLDKSRFEAFSDDVINNADGAGLLDFDNFDLGSGSNRTFIG